MATVKIVFLKLMNTTQTEIQQVETVTELPIGYYNSSGAIAFSALVLALVFLKK